MKKRITGVAGLMLTCVCLMAAQDAAVIIKHKTSGGPSSITYVTTTSGVHGGGATPVSGVSTAAQTTVTGHTLDVSLLAQADCEGAVGSDAMPLPTDTAGDLFVPDVPTGQPFAVNGYKVTSSGSCASPPSSCITTGGTCSVQPSCQVNCSGGVAVSVTPSGGGSCTVPPTGISMSGPGTYSGITAVPTAYGLLNAGNNCTWKWHSIGVTGATNNTVSVNSTLSAGYFALIAVELAGVVALDTNAAAISGGASSLVSSSFTPAQANEAAVCGTRVEALSQSPWGSTTGLTFGTGNPASPNDFAQQAYQIFSGNPGSTAEQVNSSGSAARALFCSIYK